MWIKSFIRKMQILKNMAVKIRLPRECRTSIGTLSKDDDEGSENVGKKWICVLSNLITSIWIRSICQMQATFPGVEFLSILFRYQIRRRMSKSSIKRQIRTFHVVVVQWTLKGTLRKNDDDGSENVGKKMNLRSFKLNRIYLDPLNMSNAGYFSWVWILNNFIQVKKDEGKSVVVCPRPS